MEGKGNPIWGALAIALGIFFGLFALALNLSTPINNLSKDARDLSSEVKDLSVKIEGLSDETIGITTKMDELSDTVDSIKNGIGGLPTRVDLWTATQFLSEKPLTERTLQEWVEAKRFAHDIDEYILERAE